MRQYKIQETKEIEKIICNRCGKIISVTKGMMKEDILSVEKRWGYFSNKDNEVHSFDLCEECYDKIVAEFLFPVNTIPE